MYKGKAIYNPSGKAGEYARWACNLHVGCSNNCAYCYCKRGVLGTVMGAPRATLKKCFKDENDAYITFLQEARKNREQIIIDNGLFFSFSTDPCLPDNVELTMACVAAATGMGIPCIILTKCTDWLIDYTPSMISTKNLVSVGFTLTGFDHLEPGAAPTEERIQWMKILHDAGVKTFTSFEPIINLMTSYLLVEKTLPFCDLYKFGLLSGKLPEADGLYKAFDFERCLENFYQDVCQVLKEADRKAYWKESVNKVLMHYDILSEHSCNVPAEYDIFTNN